MSFRKKALLKRPNSAKETYNFKEPTNRSHPIAGSSSNLNFVYACVCVCVSVYMYVYVCVRVREYESKVYGSGIKVLVGYGLV